MINSVSVINDRGERLDLILRNPYISGFAVESIDGLNPPKSNINTTELSSFDGSVFNSARIVNRNIVLRLILLDNETIEESRHNLYRFMPIKSKVTFEVHTDERDIYTEGYVESNQINIFSNRETASISIICPDPYFYSLEDNTISYSGSVGLFEFPFENEVGTNSLEFSEAGGECVLSVENNSNFRIGFEMDFRLFGGTGDITIENHQTDQYLVISSAAIEEVMGSTLQMGDTIKLSTVSGKKSLTLNRNGEIYNILYALGRRYDWVQLAPGLNAIEVTGNGINNTDISLTVKNIYEGA